MRKNKGKQQEETQDNSVEVGEYTRQEQNIIANPSEKRNSKTSAAQALQRVIEAWPRLLESTRQAIIAQLS